MSRRRLLGARRRARLRGGTCSAEPGSRRVFFLRRGAPIVVPHPASSRRSARVLRSGSSGALRLGATTTGAAGRRVPRRSRRSCDVPAFPARRSRGTAAATSTAGATAAGPPNGSTAPRKPHARGVRTLHQRGARPETRSGRGADVRFSTRSAVHADTGCHPCRRAGSRSPAAARQRRDVRRELRRDLARTARTCAQRPAIVEVNSARPARRPRAAGGAASRRARSPMRSASTAASRTARARWRRLDAAVAKRRRLRSRAALSPEWRAAAAAPRTAGGGRRRHEERRLRRRRRTGSNRRLGRELFAPEKGGGGRLDGPPPRAPAALEERHACLVLGVAGARPRAPLEHARRNTANAARAWAAAAARCTSCRIARGS